MSVKDRIKKQSRQEKGNEAITIILLKKKRLMNCSGNGQKEIRGQTGKNKRLSNLLKFPGERSGTGQD